MPTPEPAVFAAGYAPAQEIMAAGGSPDAALDADLGVTVAAETRVAERRTRGPQPRCCPRRICAISASCSAA